MSVTQKKPRRRRAVSTAKATTGIVGDSAQRDARAALRALYKKVKTAAIGRDDLEEKRRETQKEAVILANEFGLADTPIRFSMDGVMYSGTIIAPEPSEYWDQEKVVDYLHRTGRWEDCSTRTLDIEKFEAEIARGNIPKSQAAKFLRKKDPTTPYCNIRKV